MKNIFLSIGVIFYVGCGGTDKQHSSEFNIFFPIYNQAYQEHFEPDRMEDILAQAEDAYVLVDPFESGVVEHILTLHTKNNQVAGYISVGTGEDWREDFDALQPYLATQAWDAWAGEYYVSETVTGIVEVMERRIDQMAQWEMDWVEFDNMDWFDAQTKATYDLHLSQEEATDYINTLCDYTHAQGMKCMAKNTVEGFGQFDGVLYESYSQKLNWWDETGMRQFLDAGKLVIINHYNESDCDGVYAWYQDHYDTHSISFICEDINLQAYRHYNQ